MIRHPLILLLAGHLLLLCATTLRAEMSVYIVAPGDTLWSIANENLKSPYDWKRLMEFNEMNDASELQVDQALRIPAEWLKDSIGPSTPAPQPAALPAAAVTPAQENRSSASQEMAKAVQNLATISASGHTLAATYGSVERTDGNHKKLSLNDALPANSQVATGKNSSANIVLQDGSMLVLLAATEVKLSSPVILTRGAVELTVKGEKESPLISTQAGTVSGKEARIRVTSLKKGKQMRIEVEQGAVSVANKEQKRTISSGISMLVESGKALTEPRQGLLRPDLANLPKSSVNGQVSLDWQPIANAKGYRAQLVYAADAYLVLLDDVLQQPRLAWKEISPGQYKIRLRSIDDKDLEGLNAELPFVVQGALNPPSSNSPVNGALLPNNTPWIAWSRVPEAYTYILQVASDSAFKKDLREFTYIVNNYYKFEDELPAGEYYWRVSSVSAKQAKSNFGEVRMFRIKPSS